MERGFKRKIKTSAPGSFNLWVLFITVSAIGLMVLYYSMVYIKGNRQEQTGKRFRALARIGTNIIEREKAFKHVAANAARRIDRLRGIRGLIDAVETQTPSGDDRDRLKKELIVLIGAEVVRANRFLKVEEVKKEGNFGPHTGLPLETLRIGGENQENAYHYVIYIGAEDFFSPVKRDDLFDHLVVADTGDGVLYHSLLGDITIKKADPKADAKTGGAFWPDGGIESGILRDVVISNVKYKLFSQPVRLSDGSRWVLGGLVDHEGFENEVRKIKSGIITPLMIIFSIFILAIPVLKLFLMSRLEQLSVKDVFLTAATLPGLAALMILGVYLFQVERDDGAVRRKLETLARQINGAFLGELGDALGQLKYYDSHPALSGYNLEGGNLFENALEGPPPPLDSLGSPTTYPFFKGVSWMDETGMQLLELTTRKFGGGLVNLSGRRYFGEAGNWRFPGKDGSGDRFMLESITSVTSGEQLGAVSIPSALRLVSVRNIRISGVLGGSAISLIHGLLDMAATAPVKCSVASMTGALTSVIDPILPVGYGFCIIDGDGKVWFHSDTRRNLQENFIDEIHGGVTFAATLAGRRSAHLEADYQNNTHQCYVMPIRGLPLYLVTFHQLVYTSALQGSIILYIVFFVLVLIGSVVLLFLLVALCNYKKSLLKHRNLSFEWLRPQKQKQDIYRGLIRFNVLLILFTVVYRIVVPGAGTLFPLLTVVLFAFTYSYRRLTADEPHAYRLNGRKTMVFFLVCLLVLDITAWFFLGRPSLLVLFQLLVPALLAVLNFLGTRFKNPVPGMGFGMRFGMKRSSRGDDGGRGGGWIRQYVFLYLSVLMLVGIFPIILFYIDASNYESEVAFKHFQARLARDLEGRNFAIDTLYREKISQPDHPLVRATRDARKTSGIYVGIMGNTRVGVVKEANREKNREKSREKSRKNRFNRTAHWLKPPYNPVAAQRRDFVFSASSDGGRAWETRGGRLQLLYRINYSLPDGGDGPTHIRVESTPDRFGFPGVFTILLCLAGIGLVMVTAYYLVWLVVHRVFGIDVPGIETGCTSYSEAVTRMVDLVGAGSDLVVYLPVRDYFGSLGARRLTWDRYFAPENITTVDFNALAEGADIVAKTVSEETEIKENTGKENTGKGDGEARLVLVEDFELYGGDDIFVVLQGMRKLVACLRELGARLVIFTVRPPAEIIEEYREKMGRVGDLTDGVQLKTGYGEVIEMLTEITENAMPWYMPLTTALHGGEKLSYPEIEKIWDVNIREVIKEEFSVSGYFKGIESAVYRYYEDCRRRNRPVGEEEMIVRIRQLAGSYYTELLRSCSLREKYILYDIAWDRLVNVDNRGEIGTLLRRGLLVYEDGYRVMNRSFRDFILESVDPTELKRYLKNVSLRWGNYKMPLFLIVFGLAIFLALQGDLLSNADALVTAAIGGLAIISKLTGLFGNFSFGGGKK